MLRHASHEGVKVYQETRVESLSFENDGSPANARPVSAEWKNKSGQSGTIQFDWLIDASGRQGIMSTKYLCNRIYREGLKNVAAYGYWKDVTVFEEGGPRSNAPWFECLTGPYSLHPWHESAPIFMTFTSRRQNRMGLADPFAQWYDFHWRRYAPKYLQQEKGRMSWRPRRPLSRTAEAGSRGTGAHRRERILCEGKCQEYI